MTNCVKFVQIGSSLPDFARNAHGNIAEQNRLYGPYRGSDSTKPPLEKLPSTSSGGLAQNVQPHIASVKGPAELFKNENILLYYVNRIK
jgi:cytochrome c